MSATPPKTIEGDDEGTRRGKAARDQAQVEIDYGSERKEVLAMSYGKIVAMFLLFGVLVSLTVKVGEAGSVAEGVDMRGGVVPAFLGCAYAESMSYHDIPGIPGGSKATGLTYLKSCAYSAWNSVEGYSASYTNEQPANIDYMEVSGYLYKSGSWWDSDYKSCSNCAQVMTKTFYHTSGGGHPTWRLDGYHFFRYGAWTWNTTTSVDCYANPYYQSCSHTP